MSLIGFWSGKLFKNIPSKYLELAGGLILILLAVKSLF
jgi:putative Mn2+ efflux pump MntP